MGALKGQKLTLLKGMHLTCLGEGLQRHEITVCRQKCCLKTNSKLTETGHAVTSEDLWTHKQ